MQRNTIQPRTPGPIQPVHPGRKRDTGAPGILVTDIVIGGGGQRRDTIPVVRVGTAEIDRDQPDGIGPGDRIRRYGIEHRRQTLEQRGKHSSRQCLVELDRHRTRAHHHQTQIHRLDRFPPGWRFHQQARGTGPYHLAGAETELERLAFALPEHGFAEIRNRL